MRYPSQVEIASIEKLMKRDSFSERYHKVTFNLISEGIPTSQIVIWVHPAYPDNEIIRVARTFLWSRLIALSDAAKEEIFSSDEIQSLWEQLKPTDFMAI